MNNTELKCLVDLYRDTKRKLDELKGDYERINIKLKLLNELGVLLANKLKEEKADILDKIAWQATFNGIFYDDMDKSHKEQGELLKKINSQEIKQKIVYLELKLDALKQLLGEDNVKRIEKYEEKNILKSVTDKPSESK